MSAQKMREAFEAWAGGKVMFLETRRIAWEAWKAALASQATQAEAVGRVYKPTPNMGAAVIWRDQESVPPHDAKLYTAPPAQAVSNGWYCAHCQTGVDPSEVTFNEAHTVCGRIITDDEPPAVPDGMVMVPRHVLSEAASAFADLGWTESVDRAKALLDGTPEKRCSTCDCTGDVHRADGEWLGQCPYCRPSVSDGWPAKLSALRADGWVVACHNDYRLNGEACTFWLFTRACRAIKGEGRTDDEALTAAMLAAAPEVNRG